VLALSLLGAGALGCAADRGQERAPTAPTDEEAGGEADLRVDEAEQPGAVTQAPAPVSPRESEASSGQESISLPDLLWPVRVLEDALEPPPAPLAAPPLPENPWYASSRYAQLRLRPRVDAATFEHLAARHAAGAAITTEELRVEGALAALGLSYAAPAGGALVAATAELVPLDANVALLTVGLHTARTDGALRPLVVVVDASARTSAAELARALGAIRALPSPPERLFVIDERLEEVRDLEHVGAAPLGTGDLALALGELTRVLDGPRDVLLLTPGPEANRTLASTLALAAAAERGHRVFVAGAPHPSLPAPLLEDLARAGDGVSLRLDDPRSVKSRFPAALDRARASLLSRASVEVAFDPTLVQRFRLLGYTGAPNPALDPSTSGSLGADADITLVFAVVLTAHGQRVRGEAARLALGHLSLVGERKTGERAIETLVLEANTPRRLEDASTRALDAAAVALAIQVARRDPDLSPSALIAVRASLDSRSPRAALVARILDVAEAAR